LAGDYRRIGVYRRGHTVHLLYGDGLHAISVFAEAGQLAEGDLPAGADRVRVGNTSGSHYAWPGGDVLTWEAGGLVYTAVGDAPERDLLAAAASLPGARALPALDRLRRRCRAVVETLFGR
jgi:hypothetical protein